MHLKIAHLQVEKLSPGLEVVYTFLSNHRKWKQKHWKKFIYLKIFFKTNFNEGFAKLLIFFKYSILLIKNFSLLVSHLQKE